MSDSEIRNISIKTFHFHLLQGFCSNIYADLLQCSAVFRFFVLSRSQIRKSLLGDQAMIFTILAYTNTSFEFIQAEIFTHKQREPEWGTSRKPTFCNFFKINDIASKFCMMIVNNVINNIRKSRETNPEYDVIISV